MATSITILFAVAIALSHISFPIEGCEVQSKCTFDRIYQLGDSINDVGNLIRLTGGSSGFARLPYGQNFINGQPTGRCSNGLLIIDYIANANGLPLIPPIKDSTADFSHGANFAVAGSTALPGYMQDSLSVQVEWMTSHLHSICSGQLDCANKLRNALFMMGEIGGNDYNAVLFQKPLNDLKPLVKKVVGAILNAVRKAISLGAQRLVVPGNFPIGCLAVNKAAFDRKNQSDYDEFQCIKSLNKFAVYHNRQLQLGIRKLMRLEKPNATIVYGDYYGAYMAALGEFKTKGLNMFNACCGGQGTWCGSGAPVCPDPDAYLSWDGIHLTQEGYMLMSDWLIPDILKKFGCL